jgi:glycosyltransferase involved in cell wall biosynthesis
MITEYNNNLNSSQKTAVGNNKIALVESSLLRKLSVSCIIPLFNGGNYIETTLKSVLNQILEFNEIIIIDDNSDDDSIQRLHELNHSNAKFKTIKNDRNIGLGKTLEKASMYATSDYIMILGQDDTIPPDYLVKCSSYLLAKPIILHTNDYLINENGNVIPKRQFNLNNYSQLLGIDNRYLLSLGNTISTVGIFLNRLEFIKSISKSFISLYDSRGLLIKTYSEYKTWISMSFRGDVVFCSNVKTAYRVHLHSMSSTLSSKIETLYSMEKSFKDDYLAQLKKKKSNTLGYYKFIFFLYIPYIFISTTSRLITKSKKMVA